jgi:hypothetical protein
MKKDDIRKAYSTLTRDGDTDCRSFNILNEREHLENFCTNLQIAERERKIYLVEDVDWIHLAHCSIQLEAHVKRPRTFASITRWGFLEQVNKYCFLSMKLET